MSAMHGRQIGALQPNSQTPQSNVDTSGQASLEETDAAVSRALVEELQAENQRLRAEHDATLQETRRTNAVVDQLRLYQRQGALLIEQMALLHRQTQNELDALQDSAAASHQAFVTSTELGARRGTQSSATNSRKRQWQTPMLGSSQQHQQQHPQHMQTSSMRALQALDAFNNADLEAVQLSLQQQDNHAQQSQTQTPAQPRPRQSRAPAQETSTTNFDQVGSAEQPLESALPSLPMANTRYYISGPFAARNKNWRQNIWPWEYSGRRSLKNGLVREYRICIGSNACPRPGCGIHLRPKQRNLAEQLCTTCGEVCVRMECSATFVVNTPAEGLYHVAQFEGEHTHPPHRPIHQQGA